jgi:DNA-directed RNA polymerase subunit E'
MQEVVDGEVIDIANFGAFVRVGPLDALIHVSQVTDDFMSYDSKGQRLVGKENNKSLIVGDKVRARIIALSINETDPTKNKIAMTMRQVGLGKLEWLDDVIKKDKK